MPRRQPHSARLARVAAVLLALAGTCGPAGAQSAESKLVQLVVAAAAPALQAAAPSNDPIVAGRELLNRTLASAGTQMQHLGPVWLERVRFDLSFDPLFQPRYALTIAQPLLASRYHDSDIEVQGRIVYDAAGRTSGDVALRYRGRWYDREVALAVHGGVEDRRLEQFERYTLGAELRLPAIELRADVHDDVPAHPATPEIAERRLDGYDLEIGAQVPYIPWAWVRADRFRHFAVNGESLSTRDRIGLRLTPLAPLEIEAGAQQEAELRSWFARLRWRMTLGG